MSLSSFQLAPGPSAVQADVTCEYCSASMTVQVRYLPADHAFEWVCNNCEYPNLTGVPDD